MPEYSHIQTYIKCDQFNFREVIRHFSEVINSLGLDSRYFNNELEWEVSDNGFMYVGGGAERQLYDNNGFQLHIRPYLLGWTPEVIEDLKESYLEISILFMTEEIELDWRTGELRSECQSLIWRIMTKFSEEFKQTGVFFTNEVMDGMPWEALLSGNKEGLWAFDAAILPVHLIDLYKDYPKDMFICKNDEVMFVAQKSVWGTEPWQDSD
ncbi:hypothetical protein PAECIP111892_05184 [Paenibacillus auburnensis]|uniref:Uncharacterized protein n=1 Tax=Paenibacillus auburnensis TaxID=2905649 RepID=A0ABM9CU70_9BACL|nr:hypothetical protein [Paenibacillus auburnensis]CAH1222711.1 hypothetical protein PAECIP111892_05184 [Paenibacillus auburnensis]